MFGRSSIILNQEPSYLLGKIAYFRAALKQIFNLFHLMVKWKVSEIYLQNSTLNLNKNLYLPKFEKSIHPKYLRNSRMVLSILCDYDKVCCNKLPELFRYKCIPKLYCLIQFFSAKGPARIFILSVIPTVSCSAERSFSVLRRPKANLKSTMGQDCLSHLALLYIERAYINRLQPFSTVIIIW